MRKLILSISIIVIALFTLNNGFLKTAFAQIEEGSLVAIPPPASDSADVAPLRINYELPYPGMLPDNPFYFIKVVRDGIVKALISDPIKKAQFNLLTSQKRMYAGKLLIKKGKTQLALDTIEKSNNYLDNALASIMEAKKANIKNSDINPFLEQFNSVTIKYGEVLEEIRPMVGSSYREKLLWEEKRVLGVRNNARELLKQK